MTVKINFLREREHFFPPTVGNSIHDVWKREISPFLYTYKTGIHRCDNKDVYAFLL